MFDHPRLRTTARILAPWALLGVLCACGFLSQDDEEEEAAPTAQPAEAQPAEAAPEEAAGAPAADQGGGGGGGACSRIAACCRAYVAAMGATVPASTCDAYDNVAGLQDSVCETTMAGYRTGLQAMQKAVPSECN